MTSIRSEAIIIYTKSRLNKTSVLFGSHSQAHAPEPFTLAYPLEK